MSDEEFEASCYSEEESGGSDAPEDKSWISTGAPLKLACEPPKLKGKPLVWAGPREPRYINADEQDTPEETKFFGKERRFKDKQGNYYVERRFPVGHEHLQIKRKIYDDSNFTDFPKPITGITKLGERHRTQPYLYYSSGKNPALLLVNPQGKTQLDGLIMDVCEDLSAENIAPDQVPNRDGEVPMPKPQKILDDPWDQRRLVLKYMEQIKNGTRQKFVPHQGKDWKKAVKARAKIEAREQKQEAEWKDYQKKFHNRAKAKAAAAKKAAAAAKTAAAAKAKKTKKARATKAKKGRKKAGGGVNAD